MNMFKVNNRSNSHCSGVFVVNFAEFEHVKYQMEYFIALMLYYFITLLL